MGLRRVYNRGVVQEHGGRTMAETLAGRHGCRKASLGKWLGLAGLAGFAAFLLVQLSYDHPAAVAQATGSARAGNVVAIAGQVTKDTYGLYLVDLDNSTIGMYQWLPEGAKSGKLRLMASRSFAFDRQLDEYNTEPSVREIKGYVEEHRRISTTLPASQP